MQVRELELQIGLVQQLNSQGLRKEEATVAHATNTLQATSNQSEPPPEDAQTSGEERAASVAEPRGELPAGGEGALEPDGQRAGQAATGEGTPRGQVTGQRAESASREGTPGAGGSSVGAAAAVPMRSAAERFPADAAAGVAAITGTHVKNASNITKASTSTAIESSVFVAASASTLSNASGSMAEDRSVCGTRVRASTSINASINVATESPMGGTHLSTSTSDNTSGKPAADSPVSAVASGAAEQASRRKPGRKPFYYGPRNTAPDPLHNSAVAPIAPSHCEITPRREDSSAKLLLQIPEQAKPKKKPFAYGPRPSTLDGSPTESAAIAVIRPAQPSSQLEEKVAAAGRASDVASAAMQRSTPAGVIFVNGESPFGNSQSCRE